jgi:glycosyltransferase involved in cell wall biosynthesis
VNILYLCDEYPPGRHGGIGTAVQTLAREMVRQGHTVVVAGFYDWGYGEKDELEDEGVKVYRFRRKLASAALKNQDSLLVRIGYKLLAGTGLFHADIKRSLDKYGAFLDKLIEQNRVDIVEMTDYNDYMRFCKSYIPFPKLSKPVVVKCHGTITFVAKENNLPLDKHVWQMEHDILKDADAVCAVSNYTAMKTKAYFDYTGPLEVLYNGIRIEKHKVAGKKKNRVVYAGALAQYKGFYQLMKAWNMVHEVMPEAMLEVYGKGVVSKARAYLNSEAVASVHFNGHIGKEQLAGKLAMAEVGVFPSYAETFGLIAVETMACETAVIFTERATGPEIIVDGVEGLLVNPDDEKQIAQAIISLLKDDKKRKRMSEAGFQKAVSNFDIQVVAAKHAVYYTDVLKK